MSDTKRSDYASRQRRAQRLVGLFNDNEHLWKSLAGKRRLRRTLLPRLSRGVHRRLDVLDFETACPPQDCVGCYEEP